MTKISYYFSSPDGDISLSAEELARPFLLSAGVAHETLTLGDYFEAVRKFVFQDECLQAVNDFFFEQKIKIKKGCYDKLIIRSEKHGMLYHIASAEFFCGDFSIKFAVSSALSEEGIKCLARDFDLQQELNENSGASYLPEHFCIKKIIFAKNGQKFKFLMTLSQWLENYHEWHLSYNKDEGLFQIIVWDHDGGTFLSREQEKTLFAKTSEILTCYFDPIKDLQIYPWHHAAGDFIVKIDGDIDVKLITVRDVNSLVEVQDGNVSSMLANWVRFFLHLTIRMRLDRLDGVGEAVWLDDFVTDSVVEGFARAYVQKKDQENSIKLEQFFELLKSFGFDEFMAICQPLLDYYRNESAEDYKIIASQLEQHIRGLVIVLNL